MILSFEQTFRVVHRDEASQGPSLLKNFGGDNPYCLRFDDVTMFTQP